jgi:hypothetical protein
MTCLAYCLQLFAALLDRASDIVGRETCQEALDICVARQYGGLSQLVLLVHAVHQLMEYFNFWEFEELLYPQRPGEVTKYKIPVSLFLFIMVLNSSIRLKRSIRG